MCVQDALGVDAFNCSSEALVADALFDAYRTADEAAIRKLITSKPIFLDLDNQVNILISMSANCRGSGSNFVRQYMCQTMCLSVCVWLCQCAIQSSSV